MLTSPGAITGAGSAWPADSILLSRRCAARGGKWGLFRRSRRVLKQQALSRIFFFFSFSDKSLSLGSEQPVLFLMPCACALLPSWAERSGHGWMPLQKPPPGPQHHEGWDKRRSPNLFIAREARKSHFCCLLELCCHASWCLED